MQRELATIEADSGKWNEGLVALAKQFCAAWGYGAHNAKMVKRGNKVIILSLEG